MIQNVREYKFGETKLLFRVDTETKNIGLSLQLNNKPTNIYTKMAVTNLFQIKKVGDKYPKGFSNGRTMINSESSTNVKFVEQLLFENNDLVTIETYGLDAVGNQYKNIIEYSKKYDVFEIWNEFTCCNTNGEKIEFFPSVTVEGISPYSDDAEKIYLTKYRSQWTMEGKRDTKSFADMLLEQCWKPSGVSVEKYGYTGSMPVNGYFPIASIYDQENMCSMCYQLFAISSWQIEIYNKELKSSISLGHPDRDFGDVLYYLKTNQKITTPKVRIAITNGDVEDCNRKLTRYQEPQYKSQLKFGQPIIFNEFCSSWGCPTEENIYSRAKVASECGAEYFVIDAGWYNSEDSNPDTTIGDWNVDSSKFPNGLQVLKKELKDIGLKLGIWFEFENCGHDSTISSHTDLLLHRDGLVLETVKRRFFDFTNLDTIKYMDEKVNKFIIENEIDYIKIDYNDSIGHGVDNEQSQGIGVIQSMKANYEYYNSLIKRNPNVIFENCASGGHRLTLPFTQITNMSSFSDAHETVGIPLIAANLATLFLLKQMQIWAVLKPEYSNQKLQYLLASTFIGRMCLSGPIERMSNEQITLISKYVEYYKQLEEIIGDCDCYVYRNSEGSYNKPKGYQVVEVKHRVSNKAYLVVQSFDLQGAEEYFSLDNREVKSKLGSDCFKIIDNNIVLNNDFDSLILLVEGEEL